jgi:hypothetical protein
MTDCGCLFMSWMNPFLRVLSDIYIPCSSFCVGFSYIFCVRAGTWREGNYQRLTAWGRCSCMAAWDAI